MDNNLPTNSASIDDESPIAVKESNPVYEPRELSMDTLTPAGKSELDLSGIVNVTSSLKNSLNSSTSTPLSSSQLNAPTITQDSFDAPLSETTVVTTESEEVEPQEDGKYNVLLVVAFVFFLIALGAAAYFLYLYLK